MSRASHHRWSVGLIGTLLLVSVGLLYAVPSLFVLAVVPLGYVVYGALSSYPDSAVTVERTLSSDAPTPGAAVTVTLTVTNTGDRMLPDVRVVDGVPAELAVIEGSPRGCLSIPAGESRTFSYSVMAKRGDYDFEATTVRVRSLSAARLVTSQVEATGEQTLTCATSVEQTPLSEATRSRTGTLPTDSGGPGLEFHSTREYRAGDPTNRIDWRRFARTDELSTVNFREEHAARLILVVDARPPTRVAPQPGYPTGTELSAYAAERTYEALSAAGHQVGVTAIGLEDVDVPVQFGEELPWVEPAAEGGSTAAARQLFDAVQQVTDSDTAPARESSGAATPDSQASGTNSASMSDTNGAGEDTAHAAETAPDDPGTRLAARLPPDAQVMFVTPLLDDAPMALVETVQTHGVPVTILSPDVTAGESVGSRITALHRQNRMAALRFRDAAVIDWSVDDPLDIAMDASLPALLTA